jgi:hypothetical protein
VKRTIDPEKEMTEPATPFKPKKSVALSGVAAGNTALCTVGKTGNDLHYRGYDILDVATTCEFEEIAHLLVHGKLPTVAELAAYKSKLKSLRGIDRGEEHPGGPGFGASDGCRTGSILGCAARGRSQSSWRARYRRSADGVAWLDPAVLVSLRGQRQAHRCRDR